MVDVAIDTAELKAAPKRWPHLLVWGGFLFTFAAAVSYFLVFAKFPTLRDVPWLNLPLVMLGMIVALVGVFRIYRQPGGLVGKLLASIGAFLSVAIAAAFNYYIFSLSYQIPVAADAPVNAEKAPDFSLLDHTGKEVSLSDYLGQNVILVFYRGYW